MVKDIRKIMRLFVAGLGRTSRKWVRVSTFIGDINVSKLFFLCAESGRGEAERRV